MTYEKKEWDKSELLASPSSIEDKIKTVRALAESLKQERSNLNDNIEPKQFIDILKRKETLSIQLARLGAYSMMWYDESTSNDEALTFKTKVAKLETDIDNDLLFISLWFKSIDDNLADSIIEVAGDYAYMLKLMRKRRKYMLDEDKEKLINYKDLSGSDALNKLYSIMTSGFEYNVDGRTLNQQEVITLVRDHDPTMREKAYRTLLTKYKEHGNVLSEIYKSLVLDTYHEGIVVRGYKSPISMRNLSNDLPDKAIEALLRVCKKNEPVIQRFFRMKAKELGMDRMRRFDIYAPVASEDVRYDYDTAIKFVLGTFRDFSPEFENIAKELENKRHVHSKKVKNKRQGGYCLSVEPNIYPYVLLNFDSTLNDVSTIAHEFGHSIHYVLSSRKNNYYNAHATLPLAETASTFCEMLLVEHLKKENPNLKKYLLFMQLDNFYATIIRQAGFVRFEMDAHRMIQNDASTGELCTHYIEQLRKQLGDAIDVDDIFQWEWTYIPHIYRSQFYCYAYAFGNLLVLALYNMYQKEGASFVPKFIDILSAGSSKSPADIIGQVGIDVIDEGFWQSGFDMISQLVDELERLG